MVAIGMIAALAVSYGTAAIYGLRYLFGRQKAPRKIQVLVAALADVPEGGSLLKEDLTRQKFLLVRSGENIRAFSTACTHLGCQVHWNPAGKTFFCPCHDGVFDADGNPVSGPPPSPLAQKTVKIRGSSIFVSMDEV
jgi:cytochrome b6-f complex iron-sulfur subunit